MVIPYRVEVSARVVRNVIAEEGEIVGSREDLPDVASRLVGQLLPQVPRYATITLTVRELTARETEVYTLARRPELRLRALMGERER